MQAATLMTVEGSLFTLTPRRLALLQRDADLGVGAGAEAKPQLPW
jgi:hypothetical protein